MEGRPPPEVAAEETLAEQLLDNAILEDVGANGYVRCVAKDCH